MNNREARQFGWIVVICGCVLIILSRLWLGLALVALGLVIVVARSRCPHCGRAMASLSPNLRACPRCHKKI